MGKRKDFEGTGDEQIPKKHKKHKKHKHKKSRDLDSSHDISVDDEDPITSPSIKLKIKLGGHTLSTQSLPSVSKTQDDVPSTIVKKAPALDALTKKVKADGDVFKTKRSDDDTSDEEKAWLDALESGKLDDNGELKKDRDPSLLTARQRALIHGTTDNLLEIPTVYKNTELTEEQKQRRVQRAKKRREQAQEKREKDKKQTVERLLKKQDTKSKSKSGRHKAMRKSHPPGFRYLNSTKGVCIKVPEKFEFPLKAQTLISPKPPVTCGVSGCTSLKKYSCSKTGVPLCSLACYKTNLELVQNAGKLYDINSV